MNYGKMPKIELHCHLDGSIRVETIVELCKKENIELPSWDYDDIKNMVVAPMECKNLVEYLERFKIPTMVMQTSENLERIAYELMEDCAKENVKYVEIRFAPSNHMQKGLSITEVLESVIRGIRRAEKAYDIKGNIIVCIMRNMSEEEGCNVLEEASKFLDQGVVAMDLAGAEDKGFSKRFVKLAKCAKSLGYKITIHAGETGYAENVIEAINLLGAERIGHGIYINGNKEAIEMVKNNNVYLEMCPTSNIQTKASEGYEFYPFVDFIKHGIKATINTDNRTVSDTTISREMEKINCNDKMSEEDYKKIYKYSVDAAFTTDEEKRRLKGYI